MAGHDTEANGELFAQFFKTQIEEPETEPGTDTDPASNDFKTFFGLS